MKKLFLGFALLIISACNNFQETEIKGHLTTDSTSGWSSITLYDEEADKSFELPPGEYTLRFGLSYPFTNPKVSIYDKNDNLIGKIKVPKKFIKRDGTFELYAGDSKNSINTNILGGRREVVLARSRYAKIRQYCTYTETYICTSTDSDGRSTTSVCTRTVSGNQDAVWESRKVKSVYRIIFDASDLANAAVFSGESSIRTDEVEIAATSCG